MGLARDASSSTHVEDLVAQLGVGQAAVAEVAHAADGVLDGGLEGGLLLAQQLQLGLELGDGRLELGDDGVEGVLLGVGCAEELEHCQHVMTPTREREQEGRQEGQDGCGE